MKISKLPEILSCRSIWDGWTDRDVTDGYTSDLLSDVMGNADEGRILITIQAHKNTVAVALLKDLSAILIASDRPIPEDMINAARDEDIPIFVTGEDQYTSSWKLQKGLES